MAALTTRVVANRSAGVLQSANSTYYYPPIGNISCSQPAATRAYFEWKSRSSYTVGNFFIYVSTNSISNASTAKTTKNGVAGNPQVSLTGNTTGVFEDTSNTIGIVATDTLCIEISTGKTAHTDVGGFSVSIAGVTLANSSNISPLCSFNPSGTVSISTYFSLGGDLSTGDTGRTKVETKFKTAATLSYLRVYVASNADATNCTFTLYKNNTATSLTVTIAGSTTGQFEDNSNSASIAVDDLVCFYFAYAGSGLLLITSAMVQNTSDARLMISNLGTGTSFSASYTGIEGMLYPYSVEAWSQMTMRVALTAKKLAVYCTSYTSTSSVTLRKNASNTTLTVSVTGTGWVEDTTHSESIATTDKLSMASSGGTISVSTIQFEYPGGAAAGPANVKTIEGLAVANVSALQGLTYSSVKTVEGLT